MYKPLVLDSRQSSQPKSTRSQNLSTEVVFLWTQHAEAQQLREVPNGRHKQRLKKKRSPEETLDGLHTGVGLHQPRASCSLVQKS